MTTLIITKQYDTMLWGRLRNNCFVLLLLLFPFVPFSQTNKPTAQTQVGNPTGTAYKPSGYVSGSKANYVRSWQARKAITNVDSLRSYYRTAEEVSMTTVYVDGLGRQLQTVTKQGSPNKKDLVAPVVYDELGRQTYQFLPYADTGISGVLKTNPFDDQSNFYKNSYIHEQPDFVNEQYFYGKSVLEASPLGKPIKSFAPGNSWVGSEGSTQEHAQQQQYLVNTTADSVRNWKIVSDPSWLCSGNDSFAAQPTTTACYAPRQLMKTVLIDENGHQIVVYKDKAGRMIEKKVQVYSSVDSACNGWLCTYYVYDVFGLLRCIIPPKAVVAIRQHGYNLAFDRAVLNELCFRYEYDARHRTVAKKIPGQGWSFTIYDKADRVVLSQNAQLAHPIVGAGNNWAYILYDPIGRPSQTGFMVYSNGYCALRDHVDSVTTTTTLTLDTVQLKHLPSAPPTVIYNEPVPGLKNYQASETVILNPGFETSPDIVISILPNNNNNNPTSYTSVSSVSGYALPFGAKITPLTLNYYDDYSAASFGYYKGWNSMLTASVSNADSMPTYATRHTMGMPTLSRVRILPNPNDTTATAWMENVSFYDEKGRMVQNIQRNSKGGNDTTTVCYSYIGQALTTYTAHYNPVASNGSLHQQTTQQYDHAGRLLSVVKKVNDDPATQRYLARYRYDALGKPLSKAIGQQNAADTTPMENQQFTYNIRGWLKGLNESNLTNTNSWFACGISYEWGFDSSQYNGNISGIRWQTKGSGAQRAYGYGYDLSGRLLYADFNQNFGSSWSKQNNGLTIDYSIKMGDGQTAASAYDENGNILRMQQKGLQLNTSTIIDDLSYSYNAFSNKLQSVSDTATATNLGDFTDNNKSGSDYAYDSSGNMVQDKNKGIDSIIYNQLNLPFKIVVHHKGTIQYTYDAMGKRLEKTTTNDSTHTVTTTSYLGGAVYENNSLQFMGQEEGRIRPTPAANGYVYDYFVRDHLGNVRLTLTDEKKIDYYPAATLENADLAVDTMFYQIDPNNIVDTSAIHLPSTYQNNNLNIYTPTNNPTALSAKMYKLGATGSRSGLGITLKVMAGDTVNIFGKMLWRSANVSAIQNNSSAIANQLSALLSPFVGSSALSGTLLHNGGGASYLASNSGTTTPLSNLLDDDRPPVTQQPKAYINWILFDEQFVPVANSSGYEIASKTSGDLKSISTAVNMLKNGYLYVYCSNESNIDVYFDNLQVVHKHGPLLEENSYYPFGLQMAGISAKAANSLENKYKFNGGTELNNDLGLGIYETPLRGYDAQIGRFGGVDIYAEEYHSLSGFAFVGNNPVYFSDPSGARIDDWYKDSFGNLNFDPDIHSQDDLDPESGDEYLGKRLKITTRSGTDYWLDDNGDVLIYNPNWENLDEVTVSTTTIKKSSVNEIINIETISKIIESLDNSVLLTAGRGFEAANKFSPAEIFKNGAKITTNISRGLAAVSIILTTIDAISSENWQTKHTIDVIASGLTFVPFVGEVFGPIWFASNLISLGINGKGLSENIQIRLNK